MKERVAIEELVDLERLTAGGHEPSARELRAALPRGWVLDDDRRHAHRDVRLFFREAWILMVGLVIFGGLGGLFLWGGLPQGWGGILRLALLLGVVLVAGGLVAPAITRALARKR